MSVDADNEKQSTIDEHQARNEQMRKLALLELERLKNQRIPNRGGEVDVNNSAPAKPSVD